MVVGSLQMMVTEESFLSSTNRSTGALVGSRMTIKRVMKPFTKSVFFFFISLFEKNYLWVVEELAVQVLLVLVQLHLMLHRQFDHHENTIAVSRFVIHSTEELLFECNVKCSQTERERKHFQRVQVRFTMSGGFGVCSRSSVVCGWSCGSYF